MSGGGLAMPGSPWDHASLALLLAACVSTLALVPALFVACKRASAGPSKDAPLTIMS